MLALDGTDVPSTKPWPAPVSYRAVGLVALLPAALTPGSLGFKKIKLIPDGACLFTRGVGMSCTWESERGFGERSWRYSALIDDCVVKKAFVEQPFVQNSEADPYEVSNAETMLNYLKLMNSSAVEI